MLLLIHILAYPFLLAESLLQVAIYSPALLSIEVYELIEKMI